MPDINNISLEYRYDLPSFFNYIDFICLSKFAEYAGINESKLRAYKSGVSYPCDKIFKTIKSIGAGICTATLL